MPHCFSSPVSQCHDANVRHSFILTLNGISKFTWISTFILVATKNNWVLVKSILVVAALILQLSQKQQIKITIMYFRQFRIDYDRRMN